MSAPTIDAARLAALPSLSEGAHDSPDEGLCAVEAAAWVAREPHSDAPPPVSDVVAAFYRHWNDDLPSDADRDRLLRDAVVLMIGTRTTAEDDETRAWMALDWLVRVYTPAWLRAAGSTSHADALEALAPLASDEQAAAASPPLRAAAGAAEGVWKRAAESAAWSAAGSAARGAARGAAWSAARSAAGSAADSVAWRAAWSAARGAAWSAAWSAARGAAWSAAWSAAESAADSAAWRAAWSAADSALAPTVAALQASAQDLGRRMCAVGRGGAA